VKKQAKFRLITVAVPVKDMIKAIVLLTVLRKLR